MEIGERVELGVSLVSSDPIILRQLPDLERRDDLHDPGEQKPEPDGKNDDQQRLLLVVPCPDAEQERKTSPNHEDPAGLALLEEPGDDVDRPGNHQPHGDKAGDDEQRLVRPGKGGDAETDGKNA